MIVIGALALAAAIPIFTEQHRFAFVWNLIAWAMIGLIAITLWHYRAIRRRPVLFYSLFGMVVFFAVVVAVAYLLPDCGLC